MSMTTENSSINVTDAKNMSSLDEGNNAMNKGFFIFYVVMESIILVFGTIGNVLVVLVVVKRHRMRTVTNYFILNLAISDLIVLISNIPIDFTMDFMKKWVFGKVMCLIIRPLQTLGTTASILTLVAICLSRYHAIIYPFHRQLNLPHAKVVVISIWIISMASIIPYAVATKYESKKHECMEDFESIGMSYEAYTITLFTMQYVLPMIIMTYAYNRIRVGLRWDTCRECGTLMDPCYRRDTRTVIRMLSIVVLAFGVLTLPLHIVWIWHDFFDGRKEPSYEYIKTVAIIMLYGNSFANPIIYNICSDQFRDGFAKMIGSLLKPCNFFMKITKLCQHMANTNRYNTDEVESRDDRRTLYQQRRKESADIVMSESACGGRCAELSRRRESEIIERRRETGVMTYVTAV